MFIFIGCTAQMVSPPGKLNNSPFAPVNEALRPGVIKYLNAGVPSVRESRREDAYRQMHQSCNGKYQIDAEGPREEGGTVMAVSPTTSVFANSQYWYIQFSCLKD
jgi:hypothetical protein